LPDVSLDPTIARAYIEVSTNRVILSFRPETERNRCVIYRYWPSVVSPQDAEFCKTTSSSSSDFEGYYQRGLDMLNRIKEEYPDAKILLSGYSLGGSVALTIAIRTGEYPALTYGAYGVKQFLTENYLSDQLNGIANFVDPKDASINEYNTSHVGYLCEWKQRNEATQDPHSLLSIFRSITDFRLHNCQMRESVDTAKQETSMMGAGQIAMLVLVVLLGVTLLITVALFIRKKIKEHKNLRYQEVSVDVGEENVELTALSAEILEGDTRFEIE